MISLILDILFIYMLYQTQVYDDMRCNSHEVVEEEWGGGRGWEGGGGGGD